MRLKIMALHVIAKYRHSSEHFCYTEWYCWFATVSAIMVSVVEPRLVDSSPPPQLDRRLIVLVWKYLPHLKVKAYYAIDKY